MGWPSFVYLKLLLDIRASTWYNDLMTTTKATQHHLSRMSMNDAMDEVFNLRYESRQLDDSERNQLADLAGESNEPCAVCGRSVRPSLRGGLYNIVEYWQFTLDEDGKQPVHEDCYDEEMERIAEVHAEAQRDRRNR